MGDAIRISAEDRKSQEAMRQDEKESQEVREVCDGLLEALDNAPAVQE